MTHFERSDFDHAVTWSRGFFASGAGSQVCVVRDHAPTAPAQQRNTFRWRLVWWLVPHVQANSRRLKEETRSLQSPSPLAGCVQWL